MQDPPPPNTQSEFGGGYGCTVLSEWEESAHLPTTSPQTNNRAELSAVIRVLECMQDDARLLEIAMDSQCVYYDVTGSAFRLRNMGWVGKTGPIANMDLSLTLCWIKVPSHTVVIIPGNQVADRLGEMGRVSSPLYHVLSLSERLVTSIKLPFTPLHAGHQQSHAVHAHRNS